MFCSGCIAEIPPIPHLAVVELLKLPPKSHVLQCLDCWCLPKSSFCSVWIASVDWIAEIPHKSYVLQWLDCCNLSKSHVLHRLDCQSLPDPHASQSLGCWDPPLRVYNSLFMSRLPCSIHFVTVTLVTFLPIPFCPRPLRHNARCFEATPSRSPTSRRTSNNPLSELLTINLGYIVNYLIKRTHPTETTHPNQSIACTNNCGTVGANCPLLPLSDKQQEFVHCANCLYLHGWFWRVLAPSLQQCKLTHCLVQNQGQKKSK